jgi:hypothetical protein
MAPTAKIYDPRTNVKQELKTTLAPPGMGRSNAQVQQGKRQTRAEEKKQKAEKTVEGVRTEMRGKGLHLCDERCPETGRYCKSVFLTENGLSRHSTKAKHYFPQGISSRDKLLFLASKAGGAMALNSRPNRLSGSVLHQSVIPTQDGAPGSRDAVCYRKFN